MSRFQVIGPDSMDQVDIYDEDSPRLLALTAEDRAELLDKLLAAKAERPLHDLTPLLELDNWHQVMELVTQVATEPADNAIEGELPGMVDYLLDRGWTIPRIRQWLLLKAAGPLPWLVCDGWIEAGEQTPELGRFATEELGARFIETLPDYLTGRYSLDGPGE